VISVVVPAHNEAAVIARLVRALLADAIPGEVDVVVVANGCSDATAEVAAESGPVRVVTTPTASKYAALRLGDEAAAGFPRLYVDADVVLGTADARALAAAFRVPGVLAVAPQRRIEMHGSGILVRWYYDVWQRLPGVRRGLYGRGVIGVSEAGRARLDAQPDVMGDDLFASIAFTPAERRIVADATVVVHAPRTTADLLRRRVRSLTATAQLAGRAPDAVREARTSRSDLVDLVARHPALAPKVAVFLALTMIARFWARRPIRAGDYRTWLRDESSRVR
jgi:hypothetical protein